MVLVWRIFMKVIPVGKMQNAIVQQAPYEHVELRETIRKAVDDAGLNVTERWALNKGFFPDGGGFPLLKKGEDVAEFSLYSSPEKHHYLSMKTQVPERIDNITDTFLRTLDDKNIKDNLKDTYEGNLKSALKKLGKVLKGKI